MNSHVVARAVEAITTVLAIAGMGYFLAAIVAARAFLAAHRAPLASFAPGVSILKSLKGLDPGMLDAFRSHCRQDYNGEFELLFGVSALDDPAVHAVHELQSEFPDRAIRLIECPARLGTNGKVSTLVQLAPHAHYEFLLVNDSDITVSPHYLERVLAHFTPQQTRAYHQPLKPAGLVTALYRGRAHETLASRLESLGIATDFICGVLVARLIEGGLRYGLGSTLAVSREALLKIGGFEALVDHLADDYELGERIYKAGYRIALSSEVVETSVPAYGWRGFCDHQLRWLRTVRDARPGGYAGLLFTHGCTLALLNVVASGLSPFSLWVLALSFFLRLSLAMTVGAEVLGDHQVLPNLWLLPVRDVIATGLWIAGFAGNTIVWRGERFEVREGKLHHSS
ncbi:MAG TPA: bacteriohopanetetrol glucosamine biosynthesis glycosyltransferase HpnI [Terracidiphilus sp.]|nr:bacteriohopanetetrol glucosamine biosynthesis glycosyltransferase HpnI [Terracidiphilus sp.]